MSEFKCPHCDQVIDSKLIEFHVRSEMGKKVVEKRGTSYMKSLSMLGVAARKAKKLENDKNTI